MNRLLLSGDDHLRYDLEYQVLGAGDPVTLFCHGLAGSIEETRPFASGVGGTRAFLHFRGHGASTAPEDEWTYPALAREAVAVADTVGARQALGVSMGAGALTALVAEQPDRFSRLALVMPAVLDRPRHAPALRRFEHLAQLVEERDVEALVAALLLEQPAELRDRPDVVVWTRRRARRLAGTPVGRALRALPSQTAVPDGSALRAVTADVLVLAGEDDEAHPVEVAEELAAALPHATLVVLPPGGLLWRHRARTREVLTSFLNTTD